MQWAEERTVEILRHGPLIGAMMTTPCALCLRASRCVWILVGVLQAIVQIFLYAGLVAGEVSVAVTCCQGVEKGAQMRVVGYPEWCEACHVENCAQPKLISAVGLRCVRSSAPGQDFLHDVMKKIDNLHCALRGSRTLGTYEQPS